MVFPQIPPQADPDDCVPLYAQRNYSDTYDHTTYTIAQKGCALTSIAMVLSYHGSPADPSTLNSYLVNHPKGYDKEGNLYWDAALQGYSQGRVTYDGRLLNTHSQGGTKCLGKTSVVTVPRS